jgi:signal transduction histidine kinase
MSPQVEALERRELATMAEIAELAGPLAHEINNFLNVLLLQLAVLEQSIPQDLRADVAEVRRQGKQLGELVKHWQQQRWRDERAPCQVHLHEILGELVASIQSDAAETPIHLALGPELPPVAGSRLDLARLCKFLLTNAVAASQLANGSVTIRGECGEGRLLLHVEDGGSPLAPQALPHFFEPDLRRREGTDHLQLAACRSIVRRLRGSIRAENLAAGGMTVIVELPAA